MWSRLVAKPFGLVCGSGVVCLQEAKEFASIPHSLPRVAETPQPRIMARFRTRPTEELRSTFRSSARLTEGPEAHSRQCDPAQILAGRRVCSGRPASINDLGDRQFAALRSRHARGVNHSECRGCGTSGKLREQHYWLRFCSVLLFCTA